MHFDYNIYALDCQLVLFIGRMWTTNRLSAHTISEIAEIQIGDYTMQSYN